MPDPLLSLIVAALIGGGLALFFWPESGLFWRWQRTRQMTERVLAEDALKQIYEARMADRSLTRSDLAAALRISNGELSALLAEMKARELLVGESDPIVLTPQGDEHALHIIRAHRLWERYLAEETGYSAGEWHERAHQQEHQLSPAEVQELASRLNNPAYDPHGDPIPSADGQIGAPERRSLADLAAGDVGHIAHLEDEPAATYSQLVAEGLAPGMEIRVLEVSPRRIRFWAEGDEHVLAPLLAANVSVVPLAESETLPQQTGSFERLDALKSGQVAVVAGIAPTCHGAERRRFLDLGILPGTRIEAALVSPSGNPVAYRVRGALIALRHDQANHIQIERLEETPA